MAFPQLNSGSRMAALTTRILKATTSQEAQKLFESVKGSVLQSKLKRKLIESFNPTRKSIESFDPTRKSIDSFDPTKIIIDPKLSFLQPKIKAPVYAPPETSKYLTPRHAKWQLISENMAKMDDSILKEYRERRRDGKGKEKKNKYPF
jgi:hypothetical protein